MEITDYLEMDNLATIEKCGGWGMIVEKKKIKNE